MEADPQLFDECLDGPAFVIRFVERPWVDFKRNSDSG